MHVEGIPLFLIISQFPDLLDKRIHKVWKLNFEINVKWMDTKQIYEHYWEMTPFEKILLIEWKNLIITGYFAIDCWLGIIIISFGIIFLIKSIKIKWQVIISPIKMKSLARPLNFLGLGSNNKRKNCFGQFKCSIITHIRF